MRLTRWSANAAPACGSFPFKANHNLNFTLLADPGLDVIKGYGTKMPLLRMSKRWTFIIDPDLRICAIEKHVDPVLDAKRVAERLKELQTRVLGSP